MSSKRDKMPEFGVKKLVDPDLILNLVYDVSKIASDEGAYAGEMDYQKILYMLKKRLSKDHEINNSLQFYWYLHGPYSTPVANGVQKLAQRDVLKTCEKSKGKGYVLGGQNFKREGKLNEERILGEFYEIIEDYDFFEPRDEILKDIYVDAPFEFQRYYKFVIKPLIEEIEDESLVVVPEGGEKKIMNKLMKAEGKLPRNNEFPKFNQFFSRFVTLSDTLFENLELEDYPEGLDYFCDIANEMWSVFCKKLRMVEHDPYYDFKVDKWNRIYNRSLKELSEKIESFEIFISDSIVDHPDIEEIRAEEDSPWGVVAQGIIQD